MTLSQLISRHWPANGELGAAGIREFMNAKTND
jgi:hypothetical protein